MIAYTGDTIKITTEAELWEAINLHSLKISHNDSTTRRYYLHGQHQAGDSSLHHPLLLYVSMAQDDKTDLIKPSVNSVMASVDPGYHESIDDDITPMMFASKNPSDETPGSDDISQ